MSNATESKILPEAIRLETEVAYLRDITDCEMTSTTTALRVIAIRYGDAEPGHVFVDDVGDKRCILRLLPDEARRVAAALMVAADEADKLDRVTLLPGVSA